ncbi:hypothetical protein B0H11DRAFT_2067691 [Mycena galericulata]|nr:hypothetical protein B0H11DRAFT_2067691 [Mycena galericulata]
MEIRECARSLTLSLLSTRVSSSRSPLQHPPACAMDPQSDSQSTRSESVQGVTTIGDLEIAKYRQLVVESRRRKKASSEATPVLNPHTTCRESPMPPTTANFRSRGLTPRSGNIAHPSSGNTSSQDIINTLAAQQRRLEEEISLVKSKLARLKSSKPKSTTADRMRRRGLWPESNPQAMIFYISDDEEEDEENAVPRESL